MDDPDPWAARAGWDLTAERIGKRREGLDLAALLDRIEAEMASAHPAAQWTMNFCLAGIGIHVPTLRARALAIGERLGLYRDYPVSKGCTSPSPRSGSRRWCAGSRGRSSGPAGSRRAAPAAYTVAGPHGCRRMLPREACPSDPAGTVIHHGAPFGETNRSRASRRAFPAELTAGRGRPPDRLTETPMMHRGPGTRDLRPS